MGRSERERFVACHVPVEVAARLDDIARLRNMSRAAYLRRALFRQLRRDGAVFPYPKREGGPG